MASKLESIAIPLQRNNIDYQVDNVALQLGLGFPVELIVPEHTGQFSRSSWGSPPREAQDSDKKQSQSNDIMETVDGVPIRKLYITNISKEVGWCEIVFIFSKYGCVKTTYLRHCRYRPEKQFAFVTFEDPKVAAQVLRRQKLKDGNGRLMFVLPADSWHQPKETANGLIIWNNRQRQELEMQEEEVKSSAIETLGTIEIICEEGVNRLNDDCLLHIFSFLKLKQVAGIERVCKRWQNLSYQVWRGVRKLNFSNPERFTTGLENMVVNTAILTEYLRRCGPSLHDLDLSVVGHNFDKSTIAVIAKYCNNLEFLRVECLQFGQRSLAHLGRNCSKLKHLSMIACDTLEERDLMSLLPKCRELSILEISRNQNITGMFLNRIQSPLTRLKLHQLQYLNSIYLIKGLHRVKESLQSLEVVTTSPFFNILDRLGNLLPNLTSLTLNLPGMLMEKPASLSFTEMSKLTKLDISYNSFVDDEIITSIVKECEALENINLSHCGRGPFGPLTDQGLMLLCHLRQLTHIDISYLDSAKDQVLKKLSSCNPRIKQLVCQSSYHLTDESCTQVLNLCNDLEWLDLSGCNGITNATVDAAVTSFKMRTKQVPLTLIVGGTQVDDSVDHYWEAIPLLDIRLLDLSDDQGGFDWDFIENMFFDFTDNDDDEDDEDTVGCHCPIDEFDIDCEFHFDCYPGEDCGCDYAVNCGDFDFVLSSADSAEDQFLNCENDLA